MHARLSVLVFLLIGLAGCAQPGAVQIRDTSVESPFASNAIPGKYAAWVQSGGWHIMAKSLDQHSCVGVTVATNLNAPYEKAMSQMLQDSLEEVVFVSHALSSEEMQTQGLDAQIFIYQTDASSEFHMNLPPLFSSFKVDSVAYTYLTVVVAITNKSGLSHQETIKSTGYGHHNIYSTCEPSESLNAAAATALRHLSRQVVYNIHKGLGPRQ